MKSFPGHAERSAFDGLRAPSGPGIFAAHSGRQAWRFCLRGPASVALLLIRLYQRTLSPALPVFFGSACGCRFSPTCSHYAAEAIRTRGVFVGCALAAWRLLKCTPLHPGGFDPVPPRRKPVCRVAA